MIGNAVCFLNKFETYIKVILGAISCELYNQKDSGKVPFTNPELPIYFAKELYRLDEADRDDRKIINEYKTFLTNVGYLIKADLSMNF